MTKRTVVSTGATLLAASLVMTGCGSRGGGDSSTTSGATGGSGGYRYAWDIDDDGTFDVDGIASEDCLG